VRAGTPAVNHVVNDSGPETWRAIDDAVGSFNKGWPGPPSWRLDPDRPPLIYTTSTGDPELIPGWGEVDIDSI
jgi:hypothetical protein